MTATKTTFGANAAEEEAQGRQIATSLEHLANALVQKNATIDQLVVTNACSTQPYVCIDQIGQSRTRLNVLHADAVQRHNKPSGDQLA
jgi:hypothetical protein